MASQKRKNGESGTVAASSVVGTRRNILLSSFGFHSLHYSVLVCADTNRSKNSYSRNTIWETATLKITFKTQPRAPYSHKSLVTVGMPVERDYLLMSPTGTPFSGVLRGVI